LQSISFVFLYKGEKKSHMTNYSLRSIKSIIKSETDDLLEQQSNEVMSISFLLLLIFCIIFLTSLNFYFPPLMLMSITFSLFTFDE